jgi:hypothetical protein
MDELIVSARKCRAAGFVMEYRMWRIGGEMTPGPVISVHFHCWRVALVLEGKALCLFAVDRWAFWF